MWGELLMRQRLSRVSCAVACLTFLTSCTTPNPSLIAVPSPSTQALLKETNGLSVAVDPYFDPQRIERDLGWDLHEFCRKLRF